jgi:hypothetical protein
LGSLIAGFAGIEDSVPAGEEEEAAGIRAREEGRSVGFALLAQERLDGLVAAGTALIEAVAGAAVEIAGIAIITFLKAIQDTVAAERRGRWDLRIERGNVWREGFGRETASLDALARRALSGRDTRVTETVAAEVGGTLLGSLAGDLRRGRLGEAEAILAEAGGTLSRRSAGLGGGGGGV